MCNRVVVVLSPQVAIAPTPRVTASLPTLPARSVTCLCARSVRWSFRLLTWGMGMATSARPTFTPSRTPTSSAQACKTVHKSSKAAPQASVPTAASIACAPVTSASSAAAAASCAAFAQPAFHGTTHRAKGTGARHTQHLDQNKLNRKPHHNRAPIVQSYWAV